MAKQEKPGTTKQEPEPDKEIETLKNAAMAIQELDQPARERVITYLARLYAPGLLASSY
jgi:hypothetical protein